MAVHAESNIQLNTIPAQTSLLGGHFVYFQGNIGSGGNTPASANVIADSRYLSIPAQWGYNTHIGANGIKLRHNETTLSEWKTDRLTFYKPGTNNPSLELISGINTALNIYNPTNNIKTLGLDTSGLNFYGTSASAPDVTLNADGLTLINGSIRGGIVGQDEFLYLSPQVFADEYEEYVLSEDTEVDETKVYYIRSGEEGAYIYTEVSEPTGNPQENEYYEIAHAPGTIPIDNYVKDNWRQIIGRKFAVDTDGNLYANGLNANNAHLQQAEVEGAIVATSLTIGSGSDAYDGAAAINISGYDIEIEKNGTDEVEGVSVYLYPILYHNGVQVPTIEVDYSHFIWYQDDSTIGTEGDGNNSGRYLATYGHNYRVIYDFDDGAVGGGMEVVDRTIDPSKYITKISDTGITIHPEVWTNLSSYIQLNGAGMELFNSNGNSIAQYGSTARVGLNNSSRFLMNSNSLEAYDSNNVKYFEVTSSGLSWGSNTAATTDDLEDAAKTATNYISIVDNNGITIHSNNNNNNNNERNILINSNEISIRNGLLPIMTLDNDSLDFNTVDTMEGTYTNVASFGASSTIGVTDDTQSYMTLDYHSLRMIDKEGDYYLYISDRRGESGFATLEVNFLGNGETMQFDVGVHITTLNSAVDSSNPSNVATISTTNSRYVVFSTAPANGAQVTIVFTTTDQGAKAYTLGIRDTTNDVLGASSVVLNRLNVASGPDSCASGYCTVASGNNAHAEGLYTTASGSTSHAEGKGTTASGYHSHAEGYYTTVSESNAHAEGYYTTASGYASHAEGMYTETRQITRSSASHVGGMGTITNGSCRTAIGSYNEDDLQIDTFTGDGTTSTFYTTYPTNNGVNGDYDIKVTVDDVKPRVTSFNGNRIDITPTPSNGSVIKITYPRTANAFVIGNGTANARSNALTVNWNGNTAIAGTLAQSSDRKLKDHISYLSADANEFIRSLKPAYFKKDDQFHVGFYAQDVEQSDKWHCMTGEMNGFKTLGYTEIIAPLVAYCQHLEERIKQLEEK